MTRTLLEPSSPLHNVKPDAEVLYDLLDSFGSFGNASDLTVRRQIAAVQEPMTTQQDRNLCVFEEEEILWLF